MSEQPDECGFEDEFDALVAQCLDRIKAYVHEGARIPGEPQILAERVARIAIANRSRRRVPHCETPNPRTSIPDRYIDELLHFIQLEDARLVALQAGDEAAWRSVLELLKTRAYSYLSRGGMEAGQAIQLSQDFAQTSAVTLWELALERYPFDTPFDAWVSRIVAYEVSRWRRSAKEQRQQRAISLDVIPDARIRGTLYDLLPDPTAAQALNDLEARLMLERALLRLSSEEQRQTILRQLAGQTDGEIARALGRTRQAVYNLRHRALRALRRILARNRNTE